MAKAKQAPKADETIVAYKGFDKNLQCRGMQYAVGGTFKHEGPVEACESGLHACEYPLDVFNYYAPGTSRFAVVKASGAISRKSYGDTKIAAAQLTIEAELGIPELVSRAIEWVTSRCLPAESDKATGYRGAASATGYRGAASATGAHAVACGLGWAARASGAAGCAIVLVHRADDGSIVHIRASKVGENGIKPDTFYALNASGEFVEVA